ncbi:hypothetical protein MTBSS4_130051 [Magnetospirillum sp. SS-4]|nr:hypothetical protein MTBSS4_130051 [Magnetospirillum sp. SS-4]
MRRRFLPRGVGMGGKAPLSGFRGRSSGVAPYPAHKKDNTQVFIEMKQEDHPLNFTKIKDKV